MFKMPKARLRALIVWALGGEPVVRGPDPVYDPAALDKVVSQYRKV
jgi:hypothetical protein